MEMLVTWILCALCLYIVPKFISGFKFDSFSTTFAAAALIGFFNMWLRPLLLILTLPINILTLGLFTFVVNACVLKLSAKFIKGFEIHGWWPAIFAAIVLAILHAFVF